MNRAKLDQIKQELGWKPNHPSKESLPYIGVRLNGDNAYISGNIAFSDGEVRYKGRIGKDLSIEDAKKSAALSMINCLDSFDKAYGLENLDKVLKVTGYLCCTEDVIEQPQIMNAASEVLTAVFGEDGLHARAALGIHTLPLGASVEVELVVKVILPSVSPLAAECSEN
ncbi:RidA family protein [Paenibacillus solisilvae]|uniref:RidA family protein n=1 Tax=Paenibacillus solisilvae TaxID=2486751 RepID=A0ABW0W241_9BACL